MQVSSQNPYGTQSVHCIPNVKLCQHVAKLIDGLHHVARVSGNPIESVAIFFQSEGDKTFQLVGSKKSPDNVAYIQAESKLENDRAQLRLELTEGGVIATKDEGQFFTLPKIWSDRIVEANKRVNSSSR